MANLTQEQKDAIMTLIESVERTYEDDAPEKEAHAIEVLVKLIGLSEEG